MLPIIRFALVFCALKLILLSASPEILSAVELQPGDIIVDAEVDVGFGNFAIFRVDPTTGAKTEISGKNVGSGPEFTDHSLLSLSPSGEIYAASGGAIYRIDPATGNRTIVSDSTHGSGPPELGYITGVQTLPDGSLLACSYGNELARVDPVTGSRTALPDLANDPPGFTFAAGLSIAPNGEVWIADNLFGPVLRYDVNTGEHSIVSSSLDAPLVGTGPAFGQPVGQTFNLTGDLFYVCQYTNILSIDPATGNRAIVSSWDPANLVGTGDPIGGGVLRIQPDGSLLTQDISNHFYRVNPVTGDRTLQFTFAAGEKYYAGDFIVVPNAVPEPSTLVLGAVGGVALLATALRRRTSA